MERDILVQAIYALSVGMQAHPLLLLQRPNLPQGRLAQPRQSH